MVETIPISVKNDIELLQSIIDKGNCDHVACAKCRLDDARKGCQATPWFDELPTSKFNGLTQAGRMQIELTINHLRKLA